jgi:hypothetical protein
VHSGRLFSIMPGYEALDAERRVPGSPPFISDYHGGHPFVDDYLGSLASSPLGKLGDVTRYAAVDEDRRLREKIALFHHKYDDVDYSPDQILVAPGPACCWPHSVHG